MALCLIAIVGLIFMVRRFLYENYSNWNLYELKLTLTAIIWTEKSELSLDELQLYEIELYHHPKSLFSWLSALMDFLCIYFFMDFKEILTLFIHMLFICTLIWFVFAFWLLIFLVIKQYREKKHFLYDRVSF